MGNDPIAFREGIALIWMIIWTTLYFMKQKERYGMRPLSIPGAPWAGASNFWWRLSEKSMEAWLA